MRLCYKSTNFEKKLKLNASFLRSPHTAADSQFPVCNCGSAPTGPVLTHSPRDGHLGRLQLRVPVRPTPVLCVGDFLESAAAATSWYPPTSSHGRTFALTREKGGQSPHTDSFPPVCLDLLAPLRLFSVWMLSRPEVEVPLGLSPGTIPTQGCSRKLNVTAFGLASSSAGARACHEAWQLRFKTQNPLLQFVL